jgi:hypothetical protein
MRGLLASAEVAIQMLIDVQDPLRNVILNGCFFAIILMAVAAIVPWGALGSRTLSRLAIWLPVPLAAVAYLYERAMPSRYDIRVDLLLLLPAYGLILLATVTRLLTRRRARRKHPAGRAT